jgi:hypothetical protein
LTTTKNPKGKTTRTSTKKTTTTKMRSRTSVLDRAGERGRECGVARDGRRGLNLCPHRYVL